MNDHAPILIGLAGAMGSGKNSVANVLTEKFGFVDIAVANALRAECAWAVATGECPPEAPDDIREIISCGKCTDVYWKPTSPECRRLLQWYGTEYRRVQNPDYWLESAQSEIDGLLQSGITRIVITDMRYENEAGMIVDRGGYVWLVKRTESTSSDSGSDSSHRSEEFCGSDWPWDITINNDGTLSDLGMFVSSAYENCYAGRTSYVISSANSQSISIDN